MAIPDEAWEIEIKPLVDYLWAMARRQVGEERLRSNVVALTLLEAYEGRAAMRGTTPEDLKKYVASVMRRNIIDMFRKEGRRPPEADLDDLPDPAQQALPELLDAFGSTMESRMLRVETMIRLLQAVVRLPDRDRQVVELHFFEKLTYPEIAARLDRSVDAVKRDVQRASRQLRAWMEMGTVK
jgi:RNA polymerase sigma-70 factor (ECF subfamily)